MYFPISLTIYQCIHPIIPQSSIYPCVRDRSIYLPKPEPTNIKPKSTDLKPLIHNPKTLIRKHQASAHKPNPKSTYLSIHLSLFLPFLYNRSMYFPISLTIYQCIHPIIPQSSIYPCVRDRSIYLPKPEPTNIKPKSTDLKPRIHNPKTLIRKHQAPAHKPNPKSTYLSIHLSLFLPFFYNRSMYFPISLTIYQCIHPIIPQSIVNLSMCA